MLSPQHSPGGVEGPRPWDIVGDAIDDYTCQALYCPQQQLIRRPLCPCLAACTSTYSILKPSAHKTQRHGALCHGYDCAT